MVINNDRLLQRSVRSGLPNYLDIELDPEKIEQVRINRHQKLLERNGKNNEMIYTTGDQVRLQNT